MDSDELVMDTLPDVKDSPLASVERKQQADIARQLINETLEETEKAVLPCTLGRASVERDYAHAQPDERQRSESLPG